MQRILLLLLLFLLVCPSVATACPYCTEVLASAGDEDDDPYREAKAYNRSILFMLTMPYLLTATVGFLIYRGVKAGQKQQALAETPPAIS